VGYAAARGRDRLKIRGFRLLPDLLNFSLFAAVQGHRRFRMLERLTLAQGTRMKLSAIPFGITDWSTLEATEHPGEQGMAWWRTRHFGDEANPVRVRMVEYSPGYLADHWCKKGHILLCLAGKLESRLDDGRTFVLTPGVSYQVADDHEAHQSFTAEGATLFIVD